MAILGSGQNDALGVHVVDPTAARYHHVDRAGSSQLQLPLTMLQRARVIMWVVWILQFCFARNEDCARDAYASRHHDAVTRTRALSHHSTELQRAAQARIAAARPEVGC